MNLRILAEIYRERRAMDGVLVHVEYLQNSGVRINDPELDEESRKWKATKVD